MQQSLRENIVVPTEIKPYCWISSKAFTPLDIPKLDFIHYIGINKQIIKVALMRLFIEGPFFTN